ncbi:MAG: Zn-ribbon containing protein [Candidatus Woesearchaeota archaeon]|jgi:hypothetical protein
MPHQCIKCGTLHNNASDVLIKGCPTCHSKMFFFVKETDLEKAKERAKILTDEQKSIIEKDIYDILGEDPKKEIPVILDFESINILEPGKYELDLVNLFKEDHPLVYRLEEGKYMIDLPETFNKLKPKQEKKNAKTKKRK